eukprot:CAMPEP_0179192266 /NCGR_PEP_ID=MMETSP0796-20121207/95522_1 /TAXON_ID=73915 /ORGANISM="Pyrodinium bahamense, Strain pbaha01" /LENGTH=120 /DNA_ID=CAMNT_0020896533 /DNA_START=121 /DNA_END=480 /DNA_ORIENTATION=+
MAKGKYVPKSELIKVVHKELAITGNEVNPKWAKSVVFSRGSRQLRIGMAGAGMTDALVQDWCAWFRAFVSDPGACKGGELVATEVDFANNRLGAAGAGLLLETFQGVRLTVQVLKLHHNQ